jgi:type IV pilus assembly protein PilZ
VSVRVELSSGHSLTVQSHDISIGGSFLLSEETPPIGSPAVLHFELPGCGMCACPGFVRWVKAGGFGIQFGLLGARETHAIGKLVRQQPQAS